MSIGLDRAALAVGLFLAKILLPKPVFCTGLGSSHKPGLPKTFLHGDGSELGSFVRDSEPAADPDSLDDSTQVSGFAVSVAGVSQVVGPVAGRDELALESSTD
jgi:hypothetical protein